MKAQRIPVLLATFVTWPFACGSDNAGPALPPDHVGQPCTTAAQCYPQINGAPLVGGAAVCLDRVAGGYCTHLCATDADCCAVPGECTTPHVQVCSPFESASGKYCFLGCEDGDRADAGVADADTFCATYAYAGFKCRSSGGGSQNRKVCTP